MSAEKHRRHIFGPVHSRRLGRSLGVDLVPHKTCNLDCIYCECGHTTNLQVDRSRFFPVEELHTELDAFFSSSHESLDFVTFSGAGEPTLSLDLGPAVSFIHALTPMPVALLTNGILLGRPDVLADVQEIDVMIPSLDAATESMFRRINRPAEGVDFEEYRRGLRSLRNRVRAQIWLEILLIRSVNDTREHLELLADEIGRIAPHGIQINTVYRPGTVRTAEPLNDEELAGAATILSRHCPIVTSRIRMDTHITGPDPTPAIRSRILETVSRRPCSIGDLAVGLECDPDLVRGIVETLLSDGLIRRVKHVDGFYYHRVDT